MTNLMLSGTDMIYIYICYVQSCCPTNFLLHILHVHFPPAYHLQLPANKSCLWILLFRSKSHDSLVLSTVQHEHSHNVLFEFIWWIWVPFFVSFTVFFLAYSWLFPIYCLQINLCKQVCALWLLPCCQSTYRWHFAASRVHNPACCTSWQVRAKWTLMITWSPHSLKRYLCSN